ncbi:CoA-binding protein [Pontibacter oryzae]|uniref:CoA-binding protein n=1 Tax=Pontibacter oryzae TaxID=2304593 RepID=A0A399SFR7_9BACT|nr:CoA-binding protein [Pontibacter oryzae]RIJ41659.1 CoA-binding protein [Pontibacter oryzae]
MKKTVVLGASDNPTRYAYKAFHRLRAHGYEAVPVGIKKAELDGEPIITDKSQPIEEVDTVTLYVGPRNQPVWYDYILGLKPKRIIFNPGTENQELERMAQEAGIDTMHHCTLVMLASNSY